MAIDFSTKFASAKKWVIDTIKGMNPLVTGIPEGVLSTMSDQYIVTIVAEFGDALDLNTRKVVKGGSFIVNGFLQEKISISSSSNWEGITQDMPGYHGTMGKANMAMQMATGRSPIAPWTTRRKWVGSDPLTLTLKLKFEAQNDVEKEVLWACAGLQGLTLPRGGFLGQLGIIPPGPNPYTWKQKGRGDKITVHIGNFLKFENVIVKSVDIVYENRMSAKGPIGAEVDVTIETYETLTRESLQKAYSEVIALSINKNLGTLGTPVGKTGRGNG